MIVKIVFIFGAAWLTATGRIEEVSYFNTVPPSPVYSSFPACWAALKANRKALPEAGEAVEKWVAASPHYANDTLLRKNIGEWCSGKPIIEGKRYEIPAP